MACISQLPFHTSSINEALRHPDRRRIFNVDGLYRLAAQSVHRIPNDIVGTVKLAEGDFNRIFLITMRDGFQMVERIPYPITINPKSSLSLGKWPLWTFSVPLGCLYLRYTSTRLCQIMRQKPSIFYGIHPWREIKRCMARPGGARNRFNLARTCSTRIEDDIVCFPSWWKLVLCKRPGEGDGQAGHPLVNETASLVWQETTH
jgi:hypothetical protein